MYNEECGVNYLHLMPLLLSPEGESDGGYAVADFRTVQPELGMKAKRILEINVDHPAFLAFETARIVAPDKAKKYAEIFYNQALMIAGLPVEDPSAYTDLLCSLW